MQIASVKYFAVAFEPVQLDSPEEVVEVLQVPSLLEIVVKNSMEVAVVAVVDAADVGVLSYLAVNYSLVKELSWAVVVVKYDQWLMTDSLMTSVLQDSLDAKVQGQEVPSLEEEFLKIHYFRNLQLKVR